MKELLLDNNKIILNEENHKYILQNQENLRFKSVTQCLSQFFEKFDKERIAYKLSMTHPNYIGQTAEDIIKTWDTIAQNGTKIHKEIENYIIDKTNPTHLKSKSAIQWLHKYLLKSDFDLHPEIIVFSKDLQIAGSIDLLLYDKIKDEYIIIDWKTNKDIPRTSYNNKKGIQLETADLLDCKFNHYTLQLSFFRFLLEKKYNFKINNQLIVHITDNSVNAYVTEYLFNHINAIINKLGKN